MNVTSRRGFLKQMGAAAAAIMFGRGLLTATVGEGGKFNFLVVGDSLIWGQGLNEKDKFYSLTAEWLRQEAFGSPRPVDLKVKAHSGATLKFHPKDAEAYRKAGRDENFPYAPETNIGFPSIWKQLENAAAEYKAEGTPGGADIIMLTGGLTDISAAKLLDPSGDDKILPKWIEKHCLHDMFDVLEHATEQHPNSVIAVVGYYPMISPKTSSGKLFNSWLETMSFPRVLKPMANNPLTRAMFFNKIRRKVMGRSRIWIEHSDKNLRLAVDRFNSKFKRPRAIFIQSPLTEDTCLETPNTLLFKMGKNGRVEDPNFEKRQADCRAELPELKKSTGLNYPVRYCEIAAVGHPNPAGSRVYADAITKALAPLLTLAD